MKEFDNNEEFFNDNTDEAVETSETEENVGAQPENEEVQTQATDVPNNYAPQPEYRAENTNGYYAEQQRHGGSYTPQNAVYGGSPYGAPSYNAPQHNGYNQNNGYGNGGGYNYNNQGYNPHQQREGYRNGYTDPYTGYNNSYVPNYNSPQQNGGNISYTPKAKKEKKKKSVSRAALIITCCITVALSGFFSYIGASFANRVAQMNAAEQAEVNSGVPGESTSENGSVVIYKSPEKVDTSVDKANGEALSYADVAAAVKDSVVEITTEYNMQSSWYQYVTTGAGSGVIVSEQGHIITNNHVISDEETGKIADSIKVRLTDGSEYIATVVGADEISDIAVLKIEAEKLTVAVCGNSENLAVGEELIIVGNPLGSLGGTVTNGIVSATERTIQVNSIDMTLIQTNAAVNPGNSGGGMFNMMGQLVGIVNAKSSGTGIEGLGFAIPVNEALRVTEQLIEHGYVLGRPKIGVQFSESSYDSIISGFWGIMGGIYVSYVEPGYNDNVLKVGDRVIAINGKEISSVSDIKNIVSASSVGDVLEFQVYRNGYSLNLEVVCYEKVPEDIKNNVKFDKGDDANPTGAEVFGHKESGVLIPIN